MISQIERLRHGDNAVRLSRRHLDGYLGMPYAVLIMVKHRITGDEED